MWPGLQRARSSSPLWQPLCPQETAGAERERQVRKKKKKQSKSCCLGTITLPWKWFYVSLHLGKGVRGQYVALQKTVLLWRCPSPKKCRVPSLNPRTEDSGQPHHQKKFQVARGNGTRDTRSPKTNLALDPALLAAVPVSTKNWYPVRSGEMKRM